MDRYCTFLLVKKHLCISAVILLVTNRDLCRKSRKFRRLPSWKMRKWNGEAGNCLGRLMSHIIKAFREQFNSAREIGHGKGKLEKLGGLSANWDFKELLHPS